MSKDSDNMRKIMDMIPGTKFLMGSTPCMRVNGLGPTGHVSLITGAINVAILQPEDRFQVIEIDIPRRRHF